MRIREFFAVCMGAALVVAACGCGGSGGGGGGPVGAGDIIQQEGFTVRAVDPTGLETTDLTTGPSSQFEYVAFAGTATTLFAWRSNVPPPAELAPILFRSDRGGDVDVYVMDADGGNPVNLTNDAGPSSVALGLLGGGARGFLGSGPLLLEEEIYGAEANGRGLVNLASSPGSDFLPCWAPDGTKIAFTSSRDGNDEIYLMNADGSDPVNLTNDSSSDRHPCWSPDGGKIAFESGRDGNYEIYVMNADGTSPQNLTQDSGLDLGPCWSPDGGRITFVSLRDGNYEVYVMNADGSNPINLTNHSAFDGWPSWSPDGGAIAFRSDRDGNAEIYVMDADGTDAVNLTNDSEWDSEPHWSPDGIKIIFTSDRDGDYELYVMDADGSNQRNLTVYPTAADAWPNWDLRGFFRCVIGPGGRDSGYDPSLGYQREAVIAAFDENSLRSVVGINSTVGATVTVKRLEPTPSLPMADVYADSILRVTEDSGRREPAIRHIAIGNAETEGWIYRVLIAFSRETGRVASMIAFRGELGPMAAGAPGPHCQVRDTGSEVVVRGSGMYVAAGDGTLSDVAVSEVRLDADTGEVLSAQ